MDDALSPRLAQLERDPAFVFAMGEIGRLVSSGRHGKKLPYSAQDKAERAVQRAAELRAQLATRR